jgi:hypothetical protein
MVDERATPFDGTPLEPGRILVSYHCEEAASVWELVQLRSDGYWLARCPFNPERRETFMVELSPDEWVGPDLPSVLTYLRLTGVDAQ